MSLAFNLRHTNQLITISFYVFFAFLWCGKVIYSFGLLGCVALRKYVEENLSYGVTFIVHTNWGKDYCSLLCRNLRHLFSGRTSLTTFRMQNIDSICRNTHEIYGPTYAYVREVQVQGQQMSDTDKGNIERKPIETVLKISYLPQKHLHSLLLFAWFNRSIELCWRPYSLGAM